MSILEKILNVLLEIKDQEIKENMHLRDKIDEFCAFEVFRTMVHTIKNENKRVIDFWFENLNDEFKKIYWEILSICSVSQNLNENMKMRKIFHVKQKLFS